MRSLDRLLLHLQRVLTLGAAAPPPRAEDTPPYPSRHRRRSVARTLVSMTAALVMPVGFGAALIPLRDQLVSSISLLMVLPVLVVALLSGPRLATVAALAAAAAFDVFHTLPYYRFTIDDPDDIVETFALLAIGLTTGYLADSARRSHVAARVRHHELAAISDFFGQIATPISDAELAERAAHCICSLLDARECVWRPEYRGTVHPVLRPDGALAIGTFGGRTSGGGVLPANIEIPVGLPPLDHGRFVVRTDRRATVSLEERRAAATVAATLARFLDGGVSSASAGDAERGGGLVGDEAGGP